MTNLEDRLQKLNTYKSIQLTEDEKNALRAKSAHIVQTFVPSKSESLLYRGVQHGLRIALSTFLFIVFVGSSLSVVADSALPGDPLYPFKIKVNEEVKGIFLKTPEEKAAALKNRVESRVDEIKTLAETKTLTKAKQETVNKALDSHVKELSKELTNLSDESPTTALTVTASLEENLIANKAAIAQTPGADKDENVAGAIQAIDGTLKAVNAQEVKIISKEIDNIVDAANTVPVPSTSTNAGLDATVSSDDATVTNSNTSTVTTSKTPIKLPSVTPIKP